MKSLLPLIALVFAPQSTAAGDIERIWLTHKTNDPSKIVVNWITDDPSDSVVRFGLTAEYGEMVRVDERTTLHHVEIPLRHRDAIYHYSVSTGDQRSADATFKAYPTDLLRVAVVADWQGKPDLSAIVKDDIHLLLTAGDNIASIWQICGENQTDGKSAEFRSNPLQRTKRQHPQPSPEALARIIPPRHLLHYGIWLFRRAC